MKWRFRRSVTIAKGLKLNFSNSGISYTTGFKGYTVTHTKNGNYRNLSIPVLGIYSREKISGTGSNTTRSYKQLAHVMEDIQVVMSMNENMEIIFKDTQGNIITDQSFIKKIKQSAMYKAEKKRLSSDMALHNLTVVSNWEKENRDFFQIYEHSPKVISSTEYLEQLNAMQPEKYVREKFGKVPPTEAGVRCSLAKEAEQSVNTVAFWKLKKLRQEYVDDRIADEYSKQLEKHNIELAEFERRQDEIEQQKNQSFLLEYEEKRDYFSKVAEGIQDVIFNEIDTWISSVTLPFEIQVNYDYDEVTGHIFLDLDLPEIDNMPDIEFKISESGRLIEKKKAQKTIKDEYQTLVYGLGIFLVTNIFNISPHINGILVSAYTQRKDKKNNIKDTYVYSIKFEREPFERLDVAKYFSPYLFCIQNFECRGDHTLKEITPFISFNQEAL